MFRAGQIADFWGLVPLKLAGFFVARGAERAPLTLWVSRLG